MYYLFNKNGLIGKLRIWQSLIHSTRNIGRELFFSQFKFASFTIRDLLNFPTELLQIKLLEVRPQSLQISGPPQGGDQLQNILRRPIRQFTLSNTVFYKKSAAKHITFCPLTGLMSKN